jgi:hypothetical protein
MMARLILILAVAAAVLLVAGIAGHLLAAPARGAARREGDGLPDTLSTVAYALLILLMFGVVTGWLGGL